MPGRHPAHPAILGLAVKLPLSEGAFLWICRFNGVRISDAPEAFRYAPNEYCRADSEFWGAQPRDVQERRVAWSRLHPSVSGPWRFQKAERT